MTARTIVHSLACVAAASVACSNSDLFIPHDLQNPPLDNKMAVSGSVCADRPAAINAYLKIMFIIDASGSMSNSVLASQAIVSAQKLVLGYITNPASGQLAPGVEFAVVRFGGDVSTLTRTVRGLPGFSANAGQVIAALASAIPNQVQVVLTPFDGALALAFTTLNVDMARLPPDAVHQSHYEVVFLSDGYPEGYAGDNCVGNANSPQAAVQGVKRIMGLGAQYSVDIHFNTAFLQDPGMAAGWLDDTNCTCFAIRLSPTPTTGACHTNWAEFCSQGLNNMAVAGKGTYVMFSSGEVINFGQQFQFGAAERTYVLTDLVTSNLNALPDPATGGVLADSDGDFLSDDDEAAIGTFPFLADSDGDGYGDGLEWRFRSSGLSPLDPTDANCPAAERVDTDKDGLRDCEEVFVGTNPYVLDSDSDGVPDNVELALQTNPNSAHVLDDYQVDTDADGGNDAYEDRWHTDPRHNDAAYWAEMAYQTTYDQLSITTTSGQACYEFAVSNISLASTVGIPATMPQLGGPTPDGMNRIMLYFAERPSDNPLAPPTYREACIDARYVEATGLKMPASGHVTIPMYRPSDTYQPTTVLRPNNRPCQMSVDSDCGASTTWCRWEDNGPGNPLACNCYMPPAQGVANAVATLLGPCPQCSDGLDNDKDGLTDYPFDPSCCGPLDNAESSTAACPASGTAGTTLIGHGCAKDADCARGLACYLGKGSPGTCAPSAVCFFCEQATANNPNQCDLAMQVCRSRSGKLTVGNNTGVACVNNEDCRGAPCIAGICEPCLTNADCNNGKACDPPTTDCSVCDPNKGWCMSPPPVPAAAGTNPPPKACKADTDCNPGGQSEPSCNPTTQICGPTCTATVDPTVDNCSAATCDTVLGVCTVDPYWACQSAYDCLPNQYCSPAGFCLTEIYATARCSATQTCSQGTCDQIMGWCLPGGSLQCVSDAQCPLGTCQPGGYCQQQSFVTPAAFRPELDCLHPQ